jgi:hypothetical protein
MRAYTRHALTDDFGFTWKMRPGAVKAEVISTNTEGILREAGSSRALNLSFFASLPTSWPSFEFALSEG